MVIIHCTTIVFVNLHIEIEMKTYKYENIHGKIEIAIPKKYKKLGISLSGGSDSAFMSYLLFDHITKNSLDHEIYFVSGIIRSKGKWKKFYTEEIVDFITDKNSKVDVKSHDVLIVDELQEMFDYERKLLETKKVDIFLNATTQNPPYEELLKYDMLNGRLLNRDEKGRDVWRNELGGIVYKPFINVNKKFIAQGYSDYNLMTTLFTKTISCEKRYGETNYNELPCKQCWWCKEKYWAFGVYDMGVV